MRLLLLLVSVFLFASVKSFAQLRLPSVISSGMVLQQNDSVTFWGWGYNGQQVNVTGSWNNQTSTGTINNISKWSFKIKTPAAGGPYTIKVNSGGGEIILTNVMVGEVWLCSGQSNMEWSFYNGAKFIKEELPTAYNTNIRFFQVPRSASDYPQDDLKAEWKVCDSNSLKAFSAVGYYFGKKLQQQLNVPIGLINSSWGGTPAETWTPSEDILGNETLKKVAAELKEVPWGPVKTALNYNGMIHPLTKYNIAGAIWYQGEANVGTYSTYSQLLTTMIDAWRRKWNKELPFYYVQIAPFRYGSTYGGALLQEQQTKTMKLSKTGMVVITDLVDTVTDIHPSNKRDVGNRLAGWALGDTYHKNAGVYKSPMFTKAETMNDRIILTFDNAPNGLIIKGKTITGFYISGTKEQWLPAEAKIENNQVIVWNNNLKQPAQVRYGFGDIIIGNVFSKEGLPLCPFRTDNWPVVLVPEKN